MQKQWECKEFPEKKAFDLKWKSSNKIKQFVRKQYCMHVLPAKEKCKPCKMWREPLAFARAPQIEDQWIKVIALVSGANWYTVYVGKGMKGIHSKSKIQDWRRVWL